MRAFIYLHVFNNTQTALHSTCCYVRKRLRLYIFMIHLHIRQLNACTTIFTARDAMATRLEKERRRNGHSYHTRSNAQPAGHTYAMYSVCVVGAIYMCRNLCCWWWTLSFDASAAIRSPNMLPYIRTHARTHTGTTYSIYIYDILDIGQPALDNTTHTHTQKTQINIKLNAMWPHCRRRRRRSLSMCGVDGSTCMKIWTLHRTHTHTHKRTRMCTHVCVCVCVCV